MKFIFFVFILGLIAGCSKHDFPDEGKLESLRVLALIADKPEASPLDTVIISPLISDIKGEGRALVYTATGCVDPGYSFGEEVSCRGVEGSQVIAASLPVTSGSANYTGITRFYLSPDYTGVAASFNFVLPDSDSFFMEGGSPKRPETQYNGVSYIVDYVLSTADGASQIHAFKRIVISTKTQQNSNPTLTDIQTDGISLISLPTLAKNLIGILGSGVNSAEDYVVQISDGSLVPQKETPTVRWYASEGSFQVLELPVEESNSYTPPSASEIPTSRPVILIGVIRDKRGGEGGIVLAL